MLLSPSTRRQEIIVAFAPVPSSEEIGRLYVAGELPAELAQYHETPEDNEDVFVRRCVELHNKGEIDLISLPTQRGFAELEGHSFFTAQHFYCEAIPSLRCELTALMRCCKALVQQAGNDMASNQPNGAFRLWCERNPSERSKLLDSAEAGDGLAREFLTFALQAANDPARAINFIKKCPDDRRLSGMTALGRMNYDGAADAGKALHVLEGYVDKSNDDHDRTNALASSFSILHKHYDPTAAERLIQLAVVEPGPSLLYAIADVIWQHGKRLDAKAIVPALTALLAIGPQHTGTLRAIDSALRGLLDKAHVGLVLDYLTDRLHKSDLTISNFESTAHALASGDRQRLYDIVVRWLLSGHIPLGNNVVELLRSSNDSAFEPTTMAPTLPPSDQLFLCHKAIGFLFLKPITCCSILVSMIRVAAKNERRQIGDLLFDPMLINFGGAAREYAQTIRSRDPAYKTVKAALAKSQAYLDGLKSAGTVKELLPSDYQSDVVLQHLHDDMRAAQKLAESKSVLLNLVRRSTILYGRRSLVHVTDPDGTQKTVEMDLKSHGTSIEFPRWEILDPVGLDLLIRIYRAEKKQ